MDIKVYNWTPAVQLLTHRMSLSAVHVLHYSWSREKPTSIYLHTTMQLFKVWFSLLALAVCVFAAQPPTELQIETTFMPEECPQKAVKGDTISVHYVSPRHSHRCCSCLIKDPTLQTGTLFEDGTKFDSR